MLTKSWKSAAFMAAVVIVVSIITYLLGQHLISPGLFDVVNHLSLFTTTELIIGAVALLLVLFVGSVLGAFLIYPLDESHFGLSGALRWLAVGFLQGAAMYGLALLWALLPSTQEGLPLLLSILLTVVRVFLTALALCLIHWLVFRLPARLRRTGG